MRVAPLPFLALALVVPPQAAAQSSTADAPVASAGSSLVQKRPLRLDDYYRMRDVGSPRISPDGQWVAYTVSLPVEETNDDITESYIVRADGSAPPVRVMHAGRAVESPRWTDDNRLRYDAGDASFTVDPASPAGPATPATPDPRGIASPMAAGAPAPATSRGQRRRRLQ
jgi:hypothetical protein